METIDFEDGITSIPENLFRNASLSDITIPDTVTEIGEASFYGCRYLKELIVPDSVKTIEMSAFYGCSSLSKVNLGTGVESIGPSAFYGCKLLDDITLGKNVSSIGSMAFGYCTGLRTARILNESVIVEYSGLHYSENIRLYINKNLNAIIYAIEKGMDFLLLSGLPSQGQMLVNGEQSYIREKAYLNADGTISLRFGYSIRPDVDLSDKRIQIFIPNGTEYVGDSLLIDGKEASKASLNGSGKLIIPVSSLKGTGVFRVRPKEYGDITSYAILTNGNGKEKELIGIVKEAGYEGISLEGAYQSVSTEFSFEGMARPDTEITIYLDDKAVGTVKSLSTGRYTAKVVLDSPKDKQTYSIRVEYSYDGKTYSAEKKIKYDKDAIQLLSLRLYDISSSNKSRGYLDLVNTKENKSPSYTVTSRPFVFEAVMTNADKIKKLYVNGTKNGVRRHIEAKYDPARGSFVATGYFGESNKAENPGKISVSYTTEYEESDYSIFNDPSKLFNISNEVRSKVKYEEVETGNPKKKEYRVDLADVIKDKFPEEYAKLLKDHEGSENPDILSAKPEISGSETVSGNDEEQILNANNPDPESEALDIGYNIITEADIPMVSDMASLFNDGYYIASNFTSQEDGQNYTVYGGYDRSGNVQYLYFPEGAETFIKTVYSVGSDLGKVLEYSETTTAFFKYLGIVPEAISCFNRLSEDVTDLYRYENYINNDPYMSETEKGRELFKAEMLSGTRMALALGGFAVAAATTLGFIAPPVGIAIGAAIAVCRFVADDTWDYCCGIYCDYPVGNVVWCIDPSGIVYEAVTSNPVGDVLSKAMYKEKETDTGPGTLWDSSYCDQENPQYTDPDGRFAWDVPEGFWQVVFSKKGYKDANTEWMYVPPERTGLQVRMGSRAVPIIKGANAYKDGVEILFNCYMDPKTLSGIAMKDDKGNSLSYTTEYSKDETASDGTVYARFFKLRYASELNEGTKVTLSIPESVLSADGIKAEASEISLTVKKKSDITIKDSVSVNSKAVTMVPVSVSDYDPSEKLETEANEAFVSVGEITLDAKGTGSLPIAGNMMGETDVLVRIAGTDVEKMLHVTIGAGVPGEVRVDSVSLSETEIEMIKGDYAYLKAIVSPLNADNRKITWKSSNEKVASVEEDGTVFAEGEGEAVVSVETEDGGHKAECRITVKGRNDEEEEKPKVPLDQETLSKTSTKTFTAGTDTYTVSWNSFVRFDGRKHYGAGKNADGSLYKAKETGKKAFDIILSVTKNGEIVDPSKIKIKIKNNKTATVSIDGITPIRENNKKIPSFTIKFKGKEYKEANRSAKKEKFEFGIIPAELTNDNVTFNKVKTLKNGSLQVKKATYKPAVPEGRTAPKAVKLKFSKKEKKTDYIQEPLQDGSVRITGRNNYYGSVTYSK